jgi:DNA polymerase (family X)
MASKKRKMKREFVEKKAFDVINKMAGYDNLKVCGSVRRNAKTVGDLDMVVTTQDPDLLIRSITNQAKEVLSAGKKVVRILTYGDIQCDIYITTEKFFDSHCLFLTGSKYFNIKTRQAAKGLGFRLSQYGLVDQRGEIVALSEEDILNKIGYGEYLHPEMRSL